MICASHPELPIGRELSIDREFRRKAIDFIKKNPVAVMRLIPKKIAYLFSLESSAAILLYYKGEIPEGISFAEAYRTTPVWLLLLFNLPYVTVMLLAVWAVVLHGAKSVLLRDFILIVLFWTAIHSVYFGASRFHYPLLPLMILSAMSLFFFKAEWRTARLHIACGFICTLFLLALWVVELMIAFGR